MIKVTTKQGKLLIQTGNEKEGSEKKENILIDKYQKHKKERKETMNFFILFIQINPTFSRSTSDKNLSLVDSMDRKGLYFL